LQKPRLVHRFIWPVGGRVACRQDRPPDSSMDEVLKMSSARAKSPIAVRRFAESMTGEERMLVVLKRELYEGSWDEMVADLRARLEGRPYIFKLAHRITDDLERIEKLRKLEQQWGVDLGDYVKVPP
jgi:hypothetical protein